MTKEIIKKLKQLKQLFAVRRLKDNEVCNAEPCWCGKCNAYYRNNFRKACEAEGIKIINISDEKSFKNNKIMETIKLKIQSQSDREGIVLALANSGYKVWVEVEEDCLIGSSYYVIFEYDKTNPKI